MVNIYLLISAILSLFSLYIIIIIAISFYFARIPRSIYNAYPQSGDIEDHRIAIGKKKIEFWLVRNEIITDKTVILVHAWGRDRGRMVGRANKWYKMGYNTIIMSARDHGESSSMFTGMNITRFAEDIEAIISWWGKPVILHGHSIGGGSSILVSARNPLVTAVVAEAAPRVMISGLREFYKTFPDLLIRLLYPGVMLVFRLLVIKYKSFEYNPIVAASVGNKPILLLYAEDDEVFRDINKIKRSWNKLDNCQVVMFKKGGHSTISKQENYASTIQKFINNLN